MGERGRGNKGEHSYLDAAHAIVSKMAETNELAIVDDVDEGRGRTITMSVGGCRVFSTHVTRAPNGGGAMAIAKITLPSESRVLQIQLDGGVPAGPELKRFLKEALF